MDLNKDNSKRMFYFNIKYDRSRNFELITIKDSRDNTIFKRKINPNNKTEYFDVMMGIYEKFGFKPEIDLDKDVNTREKIKEEKDKDINWFS